ncbi:MAG: hypothetical protein QGM50_00305 [Anaerolineae bacterium]|nr:hypothetical protein [Anaerolineae bacterium]
MKPHSRKFQIDHSSPILSDQSALVHAITGVPNRIQGITYGLNSEIAFIFWSLASPVLWVFRRLEIQASAYWDDLSASCY